MPMSASQGLRMMAREFRANAERQTAPRQQDAFADRAMLCEGAANEIDMLQAALTTIRDALPAQQDAYALLVFKVAAIALEPEANN